MSGVLRYAEDRADWTLRDGPAEMEVVNALEKWNPDGVLVHLWDGQLAAGLERLGCPVVSTTATLDGDAYSVVDVDHVETGREAGRYFTKRGYRNFGYFGSGSVRFSRERERGYREVVEEAGFEVESLHAEFLPKPATSEIWCPPGGRVEGWLGRLKQPAAVFCSNDIPARRVAEACREAGISVPGEVAILGVDNDTSECRLAHPHLSSIDTPAEQVGYRAAELLAKKMSGAGWQVEEEIFLSPSHVVTRASTDRWASRNVVVQRAVGEIREEAANGIRVNELAQKVGVSRRALERAFRVDLGRTILDAIQETRIGIARELLATTELPVAVVSERSGFQDPKRMGVVFKEMTGRSPREFRKEVWGG